jgi:hypothetical protein
MSDYMILKEKPKMVVKSDTISIFYFLFSIFQKWPNHGKIENGKWKIEEKWPHCCSAIF